MGDFQTIQRFTIQHIRHYNQIQIYNLLTIHLININYLILQIQIYSFKNLYCLMVDCNYPMLKGQIMRAI